MSIFSVLFFCKKKTYIPLSDEMYYKRFLGGYSNHSYDGINKESMKRIRAAYKKAWECRDFEIDKFWSRSAFFWGFIVLIFTGYLTVITKEHNSFYVQIEYLDLYLMLLGFLFTLAWLLVIKGSKAWQENWEAHIDHLENFISGPLYKTVWYSKQNKFYSVSKINEILALITLLLWVGIFCQYISQYKICIPFLYQNWCKDTNWHITLSIFITIVFSIVLCFGYPAPKYKITFKELQELNIQNKKGAFIDRYEIRDKQ
jgi:hypothetical protein